MAQMATLTPASFEGLPPELRNYIYELVIPEWRGALGLFARGTGVMRRRQLSTIRADSAVPPALARTCRLLRQDVLPIYYANTSFLWMVKERITPTHVREIIGWLEAMGSVGRVRIGCVQLCMRLKGSNYSPTHMFMAAYESVLQVAVPTVFHLVMNSERSTDEEYAAWSCRASGHRHYVLRTIEGAGPRSASERARQAGVKDFGLGLDVLYAEVRRQTKV